MLLPAQGCSVFVKELLSDVNVELVQVHGLNGGCDLLIARLEPLYTLCTGCLFGTVGFQDRTAKPFKDRRRKRLRALSAVPLLNALPSVAAHQWLVRARVSVAIPIEVSHVQSLP